MTQSIIGHVTLIHGHSKAQAASKEEKNEFKSCGLLDDRTSLVDRPNRTRAQHKHHQLHTQRKGRDQASRIDIPLNCSDCDISS